LLPVVALGFLIQPSIGGFLWVNAAGFSGLLSLTKPKVPFSVQRTVTIVKGQNVNIGYGSGRPQVDNENGHNEMKRLELNE
jgi:hypothetical protein